METTDEHHELDDAPGPMEGAEVPEAPPAPEVEREARLTPAEAIAKMRMAASVEEGCEVAAIASRVMTAERPGFWKSRMADPPPSPTG